jgi:transcriptional activator HAC1
VHHVYRNSRAKDSLSYKTNLPPRKRAKTADEKEQRRIERVKRNRLAAHNSRERKRQEVDLLLQNQHALEQRLKDAEAELNAYRKAYPQANIPKAAELPPPSQFTLLDAYNDEKQSSTIAPSQASFESPDSLLSTLDSPLDTAPSTPGNEMTANDTDLTQHSAVMLWDLQCRSGITNSSLISMPNFRLALSFLILINTRIFLMTALTTLSSTLTSSRKGAMALLARRNPSSTQASKARRHTRPSLATLTTSWIRLVQASSICSPAQARLLQSATPQALRRSELTKSLPWSNGSVTVGVEAAGLGRGDGESNRRTISGRVSRVYCINSLTRDIKRRCRVIQSQSATSSHSGSQKWVCRNRKRYHK